MRSGSVLKSGGLAFLGVGVLSQVEPLTRAANPPAALHRAARRLSQLRTILRTWYNFHDLHAPRFSWWVDGEYKNSDAALDARRAVPAYCLR
jgi:hypothetical protein